MKLNDTVYNWLKYIVIIFLPALSVLYVALASTWGWPFVNEIRDTLDAVTLFLASALMVSSAEYNKTKLPEVK